MYSQQQLANAIRFLSIDAVEAAKSGHPGMPMGMADIAQVLWSNYMRHNPNNPNWFNRDRFVLSNGHGCMLLYSLLHLSGYDLTIEDIKDFRQIHSRTPGHPEYEITPGVDATTGPLGQGLASAVGMALAQKLLASEFNRADNNIIDHYTYCFVGDGCLMEGISHEAGSFAGTFGLNKLIVFWDDNGISIDGKVANWFRDDTPARFAAYGWNVIKDVDGHDSEAITQAIDAARMQTTKPTLICCKTNIGQGAPDIVGSAKAHGAPLGTEAIEKTRQNLNWPYPPFEIPPDMYQQWDAKEKGKQLELDWQKQLDHYCQQYRQEGQELQRRTHAKLPENLEQIFSDLLHTIQKAMVSQATRKSSQNILDNISKFLPELLGGSADLSESNGTMHKNSKPITPDNIAGNYIHYGVREFGMSAMMNGIALHGGFIPFGATFLTFVDYARNALRLSALMKLRVIYVFTHDSIGLGEDGPTHQPIEHLTMLRITPNVCVWRPCDAAETVVAWQAAIMRQDGPTCLALSRQSLPAYYRSEQMLSQIKRGAYILQDCADFPDAIIIATGSEVEIAVAAADELTKQGKNIRVVSMPCAEVFLAQDNSYKSSVLPETVEARVAVEAGAANFWYQFVGPRGRVVGLNSFGASAPYKDVYKAMGLTIDAVTEMVQQVLETGE